MIGSQIGSYRITGTLGAGGMGAVFAGVHEQLGKRAAIKVLLPHVAHNPEIAARFFNEARAVSVLAHPGLVEVFEFGHLPDGSAYLVMELLSGETLGARLRRCGERLPEADVIHLGRQLAQVLAVVHDKGIVHRDLKPDNVMIVPDPAAARGERTKILDFGIAKVAEDVQGLSTDHVKTSTSALMGTPTYMSPEQCRGAGGVGDRSDVYSLGVMLYQMLGARVPFVADGVGSLILMHLTEPPPRLDTLVSGCSPDLIGLVHAMLAKDPKLRPAMTTVAEDLARLESGTGLVRPYPIPTEQSAQPALGQALSTLGAAAGAVLSSRLPSALRTRQGGWVVLLLVAAVLVVPASLLLRGRMDLARFDVMGHRAAALELARRVFPDAAPTRIILSEVPPSGVPDLSAGQKAGVFYWFRSAARSAGAAERFKGATHKGELTECLYMVGYLSGGKTMERKEGSPVCVDEVLAEPRCTPGQVWGRAQRAGLKTGDLAVLSLLRVNGKQQWSFGTSTLSAQFFDDDCTPSAAPQ